MDTRLSWAIFPAAYLAAFVPLLWIYFNVDPHFSTPREGLAPTSVAYQVGYVLVWAVRAIYWPSLITILCLVIGMAPCPRCVAGLGVLSAVVTLLFSYCHNLIVDHTHRESFLDADGFIQLLPAAATALVLCGYYGVALFKLQTAQVKL
jgi:hypothetical protein